MDVKPINPEGRARHQSEPLYDARDRRPFERPISTRQPVYFWLILKILLPLLLLAMGVATYLYLKNTKPAPKEVKLVERTWPVNAHRIQFANVTPNLSLFGQTVSGRKVELRALVAGQIVEVSPLLKEGGVVKKGDALLRIDPFQYGVGIDLSKAQLLEAKAKLIEVEASIKQEKLVLGYAEKQLVLAKVDYERVKNLAAQGTVTQKLADDRQVTLNQRKEAVSRSQTNLTVLDAKIAQQKASIKRLEGNVRQSERSLKDTTLAAPFDGYVMDVNAQLGRMSSVNDKVALLIDKNDVDVRFTLSDQQYGRILAQRGGLIGQKVVVKWRVGHRPLTYSAQIVRTGAQINANSGGIDVFAKIDDPLKPVPIRAGAFVEVETPDQTYEHVALVPQLAVYDNRKIYLIKEDRLEAIPIEIVAVTGNNFLVKGTMPEGAHVLASRISVAGNGLKVKVTGGSSVAVTH